MSTFSTSREIVVTSAGWELKRSSVRTGFPVSLGLGDQEELEFSIASSGFTPSSLDDDITSTNGESPVIITSSHTERREID